MPKDRLFDPIQFENLTEETEQPTEEKEDAIKSVGGLPGTLNRFRQEISRLQQGTSKYRKGAVYFPKGICPPLEKLKQFERDFDMKMLLDFFLVVKQDFGARVHDVFVDWMREIYEDFPVRKDNE